LHDYQKILKQIHNAGAELVAVSPVTPDNSLDMAQKNDLEFKVLSDVGNKIARQYGIVYKLPERISMFYKEGGMIDLAKYNGDDSMELPLAVTYVIDTDGVIRYVFLDADYRKRAETSEVLQEVLKLGN
jgi:peroxiredoxin